LKKSKSRYNSRVGKLFFILPILIIGVLVVYAFVELNSPGTLIVQAEGCVNSVSSTTTTTGNCPSINVPVTVGSKSGTTPWTLSLSQGTYTVNFTAAQWYYPPPEHEVVIDPGLTAYAVAIYNPINKVVQVSPSGFNTTSVAALHGVTLVKWTNPSSSVVTFEGSPYGRIPLDPGESYSAIFATAGTYTFNVLNTNESMKVQVS
jgi:plastocyanin